MICCFPGAESMWFWRGCATGILATIPLVLLCALSIRFPVPFAGYLRGPEAVVPALLSLLFYGVFFGGFIVQGLFGGIGGLAAQRIAGAETRRTWKLCLLFGSLGAVPGVMTLAFLDRMIGPW